MRKLTEVLQAIASDVEFSVVSCENPPEKYCYNGLTPNWLVTIRYKGGIESKIYDTEIRTPQYVGTLCWFIAAAKDAKRYNVVEKYAESAFHELNEEQREDIKKEISANNEKRNKLYATFGHAMYCQLMFAENDY